MGTDHEHRMCTYEEADATVRKNKALYLASCFCRTPAARGETKQKYCGHPLELCLGFRPWSKSEYPQRKAPRKEVQTLMKSWKDQGNLFRMMAGDAALCFCCSCGCGFFFTKSGKPKRDTCHPSPFIEKTDASACTLCGKCVEVCAYGARKIVGKKMKVTPAKCSGCSACEYACPEEAISMVPR